MFIVSDRTYFLTVLEHLLSITFSAVWQPRDFGMITLMNACTMEALVQEGVAQTLIAL